MPGITYEVRKSSADELIKSNAASIVYPLHFHARHQVFGLVERGSAVLEAGRKKTCLAKGGCFSVPPLAAHRLTVGPRSILRVVCTVQNPGVDGTDAVEAARRTRTGGRKAEADAFFHILRTLVQTPELPLDLEHMAALAGYSKWHFLRLFSSHTGMTPHAFLLSSRISLVRRLLREGTGAAEAAAMAGFTDQSHMHRAFKLHHGLTPGQFVRAINRAAGNREP